MLLPSNESARKLMKGDAFKPCCMCLNTLPFLRFLAGRNAVCTEAHNSVPTGYECLSSSLWLAKKVPAVLCPVCLLVCLLLISLSICLPCQLACPSVCQPHLDDSSVCRLYWAVFALAPMNSQHGKLDAPCNLC